jgi:hypothetical protein
MGMTLRSIPRVAATLLALAFGPALAAPISPDPTGMWYDPSQPGWGLSVTQQGDTAFIVLLTYDANHNPEWFVASNVVDTGTFRNFLVGEIYAGTLYQTTGPAFSAPSDTTAFHAMPVGDIQIGYVQPTSNLSVTYTINGTTVNKVVTPQTWGSNSALLTGKYGGGFNGGIFIDSTPSCPLPTLLQGIPDFNIDTTTTPDALNLIWNQPNNVYCAVSGTYAQQGQFGTFGGPVMCAPGLVGAVATNMGTLSIARMTMGPGGFSGYLNYSSPVVGGSSCGVGGVIGGIERGSIPSAGAGSAPMMSPDPTGMWYDAAHPGWGIHVTQQGATIFAVIFVYDEAHTPRWYVASPVLDTGRTWNTSDGFSGSPGELYSGMLFRTTGAFFGNDTDSTSMNASAVGTFSMAYTADNPRTLSIRYNAGGTTVVKNVQAQTWRSNAAQLSGTYAGGVSISPCACFPELCDAPISSGLPLQITVMPGSSPSTVQLAWNAPVGACKYTATYSQDGQLGALQGPVACDGLASALPLTVTSVTIGASGFSGVANLPGYCPGSIGGVKNQ